MATAITGVGAQGDPAKWRLPGWKVERAFDKGVLIGNWYEDRRQFTRGQNASNSTYRADFTQRAASKSGSDAVRQKGALRNEGLPTDLLFGHHGHTYSNNMITWYDEEFNKRERPEEQKLPALRYWDAKTLTWAPEKSDHPVRGEPTNWGLSKERVESTERLESEQRAGGGDYATTYGSSYVPKEPPAAAAAPRYAVPRDHSSSLHRYNRLNHDLKLRGVSTVLPQMPELLAIKHPYSR